MKGYVDQDSCVGCGACVATCPDAFQLNENGLAEGYQEIPAGSVDDANAAMEDCPVAAITLK